MVRGLRKEAVSITYKMKWLVLIIEASAKLSGRPSKTMNEGGYTKQKIFNRVKTAFHWKMPPRTFRGKEKPVCGFFNASKDRLAGAN